MRSRMKGLGAALAVAAVLALIVAACAGRGDDGGGDGVASLSAATSTTAAGGNGGQTKDPQDAALEFAKCMRANGVPDFPDPQIENGGASIRIGPGEDVNPRDPKVRKAHEACRGKLVAGGQGPAPDDPAMEAAALEFAKCMRANGVPDFPDPQTEAAGGPGLLIGPDSGIDPNSPTFKAAEKTCRPKLNMPSREENP
jgi:hypothetical protein